MVPNARHQRVVGAQLTGEDRSALSRTEGLRAHADIRDGGVQFPAQAVVQGQGRSNFPAILRIQIKGRAAHAFVLRRTLQIRVRKAEKVIGKEIAVSGIIRATPKEGVIAIDVKVQKLVKALAANIRTEFQTVLAGDFTEIIRPLERIADLGKFPFIVVPDHKSAGNRNEGHTLVPSPQMRSDPKRGIAGI